MPPTLLPDPARLHLEYLSAYDDVITMVVATTGDESLCPLCARPSTRRHSHYTRLAADLPWNGVAVRLRLTSRRFFCPHDDCERKIFTERLPDLIAPYARRTLRLTEALELIGFALGGEAGARTLAGLGMSASPDTVLRVIRAAALPERETPRVLGVDDFAFRRGKRYGTILVDLERRCRVDLLPDRTAETLAAWLASHPGVEVVSRDRGGAYAQGTREGAPEAEQVADRFHLLRNLHDALERHLLRHRAALQQAETVEVEVSDAAEGQPAGEEPPARLTRKDQEKAERRARRLARYEEVRGMQERGMTIQAICRATGLARRTVRTFLRAEGYPERAPRAARAGVLAPYEEYLRTRLEAGCENGQELWRELQARGYPGSASPVYAWLAAHRTRPVERGRPRLGGPPTGRAMPKPLSPRQAAWLLQRPPTDLDQEERATLERLCGESEAVATAHRLAQDFRRLVRERDRAAFDPWLERADRSGLAELQSFATGLRQDRAAVEAALSQEASNGQTEGQVNRLKAIKRQMYGRAKFDLLRKRVLHAA